MFISKAKDISKRKVKRRNKLVEENYDLVHYWGCQYYNRSNCPNMFDRDDLEQEAALAALIAADRWDPKRKKTKNFRSYVYDMANWYWSDRVRMKAHWTTPNDSSLGSVNDILNKRIEHAEPISVRKEHNDLLQKAIWTLTPRQRFVVRYVHGLSGRPVTQQKDLAVMLGVSREAICDNYRNAKKKLAKALEGIKDEVGC